MSFSSDQPLLINQLPISVEFTTDPLQQQEILSLLYKRIANAVNTKQGSVFSLQEQGNFNQYFTVGDPNVFRNVYRKVFDMVDLNGGAIAAGATVTTPHNIAMPLTNSLLNGTHIYGSATNSDVTPKRVPLPYVSATLVTDQIQIYFDTTNVVLINGATQTALTYATIVLEYLKN